MKSKTDKTFELRNGYTKQAGRYRNLTLDEIKNLKGHTKFIDVKGEVRDAKVNGKVKTWKREPYRVEVSLKYGLYEYAKYNTMEALNNLVVEVL